MNLTSLLAHRTKSGSGENEPHQQSMRLRIGIDDAVTAGPVWTLLQSLRTDCPALRWSLHDAGAPQQYASLSARDIDIAIWRGEPVTLERLLERHLCQQLYFREETSVALSKAHRLARRNSIALADFGDEQLLAPPPSASGLPALMAMVGSGLGPALVPSSASTIVFPNVTVRRLRGAPATNVYLAYDLESPSGAVLRFLDLLNQERGSRPFLCIT